MSIRALLELSYQSSVGPLSRHCESHDEGGWSHKPRCTPIPAGGPGYVVS